MLYIIFVKISRSRLIKKDFMSNSLKCAAAPPGVNLSSPTSSFFPAQKVVFHHEHNGEPLDIG